MALALLSVVYSALRAGSNTALFNLAQSVGAADEVCGHALRRLLLPELPLMSVLWGLWWMCGYCRLGGGFLVSSCSARRQPAWGAASQRVHALLINA